MARAIATPQVEPQKFVRTVEYLFGTTLLGPARDIADSVMRYRSTAVASCHASGKTFTAARVGLAFLLSDPSAIVVTSAPTWNQVKKVLWGEIHAARLAMANVIDLSKFEDPNQTEWKLSPNNYILGLSTNEGVRIQGFHGKILIILDEGAGIRDDLYEAIEGIRAGGDVRILTLGNPTSIGGRFYDAFDSPSWHSFHISAFDTPNFKHRVEDRQITLDELLAMSPEELEDNPYPFLVTKWWVAEKYREWGPQSPMWSARVLGQFPEETSESLFSLAHLYRAREEPEPTKGRQLPLRAGIDVAGPGEDETVLTLTRGPVVQSQQAWSLPDSRWALLGALQKAGKPEDFETVNVDAVGIGWGTAMFLRDKGYPVATINAANRAAEPSKYANFKAEMYWKVRQQFHADQIRGLTADKTIEQLATIRYRDQKGKIEIESKDDMRKRGVKSPDWAESFVLSQAQSYSPSGRTLVSRRPLDVISTFRVESRALDIARW